jgi:hypothetical protein
MSLKTEKPRMLGIEHQRGEHRGIEPGTDSGVLAGQPGDVLQIAFRDRFAKDTKRWKARKQSI